MGYTWDKVKTRCLWEGRLEVERMEKRLIGWLGMVKSHGRVEFSTLPPRLYLYSPWTWAKGKLGPHVLGSPVWFHSGPVLPTGKSAEPQRGAHLFSFSNPQFFCVHTYGKYIYIYIKLVLICFLLNKQVGFKKDLPAFFFFFNSIIAQIFLC